MAKTNKSKKGEGDIWVVPSNEERESPEPSEPVELTAAPEPSEPVELTAAPEPSEPVELTAAPEPSEPVEPTAAPEPPEPAEPTAAEPVELTAAPESPVAPEPPVAEIVPVDQTPAPAKTENEMLREANAALMARVNELAGMVGGALPQQPAPPPQTQPLQYPYYIGQPQQQPIGTAPMQPQPISPEQMAAIQRQQISPVQQQPPIQLSQEDFEGAFQNPEAFTQVMANVNQQLLNPMVQNMRADMMREMSRISDAQIASKVADYQMGVDFYQANKDLRGSENLVSLIAAKIQADNPGMPMPQLLQAVAKATRNELQQYRVAQGQQQTAPAPEVKPRRPAFAGGASGGSSKGPADPHANWTQEERDNYEIWKIPGELGEPIQ